MLENKLRMFILKQSKAAIRYTRNLAELFLRTRIKCQSTHIHRQKESSPSTTTNDKQRKINTYLISTYVKSERKTVIHQASLCAVNISGYHNWLNDIPHWRPEWNIWIIFFSPLRYRRVIRATWPHKNKYAMCRVVSVVFVCLFMRKFSPNLEDFGMNFRVRSLEMMLGFDPLYTFTAHMHSTSSMHEIWTWIGNLSFSEMKWIEQSRNTQGTEYIEPWGKDGKRTDALRALLVDGGWPK